MTSPPRFVPLQRKAIAAQVLLVLCALVAQAGLIVGFQQFSLLSRMAAGETVSEEEATPIDLRYTGLIPLDYVTRLATSLAFLVWFYKASANTAALGAQNPRYSPGWTIGGFIIPFANVVFPYLVAQEIWRNSALLATTDSSPGSARPANSGTVKIWWALFLAMGISRAISGQVPAIDKEFSGTLLAMKLEILSDLFSIPAAIFAILMVRAITRRQHLTFELRNSQSPALPSPLPAS